MLPSGEASSCKLQDGSLAAYVEIPALQDREDVKLLLFTGCRHSEVLKLKWSGIHGLRIKISDAKTGRRTVWLGTEARAVIDCLALT